VLFLPFSSRSRCHRKKRFLLCTDHLAGLLLILFLRRKPLVANGEEVQEHASQQANPFVRASNRLDQSDSISEMTLVSEILLVLSRTSRDVYTPLSVRAPAKHASFVLIRFFTLQTQLAAGLQVLYILYVLYVRISGHSSIPSWKHRRAMHIKLEKRPFRQRVQLR
jgi:hypothetical protein